MKRKRMYSVFMKGSIGTLWVVLFAGLFFFGAIGGSALASRLCKEADAALSEYLIEFEHLQSSVYGVAGVLSSYLFLYLRYPVAAFLLAFTTFGIVLIPGVTILFGFFLSFAATCFAAEFGAQGAVAAFALFGLRSLITIPCFLITAVPAWQASCSLLQLCFGKRRLEAVRDRRQDWIRFLIVVCVLSICACIDAFLAPEILKNFVLRTLN